jgi:hypothetical protein
MEEAKDGDDRRGSSYRGFKPKLKIYIGGKRLAGEEL